MGTKPGGPKRSRHLFSAAVTAFSIALQGAQYDGIQLRWYLGVERRGGLYGLVEDVVQDLSIAGSAEESCTGETFPEHDAQTKEIRSAVEPEIVELLGRKIAELALDDPHLGQRLTATDASDAKVGQLHRTVKGDQHVLGTHIAVNQLQRLTPVDQPMEVVEPLGHLLGNPNAVADGQRLPQFPTACQNPSQITSLHQFHGQEVGPLFGTKIVEVHQVGMREQRGHLGLLDEHLQKIGIGPNVRTDALESHHALGNRQDLSTRLRKSFPIHSLGDLFDQLGIAYRAERQIPLPRRSGRSKRVDQALSVAAAATASTVKPLISATLAATRAT